MNLCIYLGAIVSNKTKIVTSVVPPSLLLNLLHRYAQEENTRSASTEVGGTVSSIW